MSNGTNLFDPCVQCVSYKHDMQIIMYKVKIFNVTFKQSKKRCRCKIFCKRSGQNVKK